MLSLATSTMDLKLNGSDTAKSAKTLRSSATLLSVKRFINLLYGRPYILVAALIRNIHKLLISRFLTYSMIDENKTKINQYKQADTFRSR